MKVLFATSEFADFAKAGGLGEVSAGLPRALRLRGIDARVLMPAYPEVISRASDITVVAHLPGHAGIGPCCIGEARTPDGLILYLVLEPSLYQRNGSPYTAPEGLDWAETIFVSPASRLPRRKSPAAVPGWTGSLTCCSSMTGQAASRQPICAGREDMSRRS